MIEQPLFAAGDVAPVAARHCAFLVPDHPVFGVQPAGLPLRKLALTDFPMRSALNAAFIADSWT